MEKTKLKCEDFKPCNIKDKDGFCMNNERSCIWREGAGGVAKERQLIIPAVSSRFIPPDNEEIRWRVGAETFDRDEVAALLWTQRAMIHNDIKMSDANFDIKKNSRIPEY